MLVASSAFPFGNSVPLQFRRCAREARDQMDVQVGDVVSDHGGVHVLGTGLGEEGTAGPSAPPPGCTSFVVLQIGPT